MVPRRGGIMRWLAILLVLLLAVAFVAGPGCTLGEDGEANASNGAEVDTGAPSGNSDTSYTVSGDEGGGGGVFAYDMFVHIDGMAGESTDENHQGWIDVIAFNHAVSQPGGELATSGARTAVRADHGDFTVVKTVDKTSPKLTLKCCNGQHIAEITLEVCRADGDKETYMVYEMTDVIVSSVSVSGGVPGTEARPVEEITFRYGQIEWTYTEYDTSTGKPKGDVKANWDVEANTGS
jgi:type VI secretion system secreted protein Hcp